MTVRPALLVVKLHNNYYSFSRGFTFLKVMLEVHLGLNIWAQLLQCGLDMLRAVAKIGLVTFICFINTDWTLWHWEDPQFVSVHPCASVLFSNFPLLPEEDERRQKTILSCEVEPKRPEATATSIQPAQVNHKTWAGEARLEPHNHQPRPPVPAPPLPPPMPIAVIPIPVVPANPAASVLHTASPIPVVTPLTTALSPPGASLLSPVVKDSPPLQQHLQHRPLVTHVKAEGSTLPQSGTSPKQQPQALLQPYPAPVITPQHALLAQPPLAQHHGHVSQPVRPSGATFDDTRCLEGKRRPGGWGYFISTHLYPIPYILLQQQG